MRVEHQKKYKNILFISHIKQVTSIQVNDLTYHAMRNVQAQIISSNASYDIVNLQVRDTPTKQHQIVRTISANENIAVDITMSMKDGCAEIYLRPYVDIVAYGFICLGSWSMDAAYFLVLGYHDIIELVSIAGSAQINSNTHCIYSFCLFSC